MTGLTYAIVVQYCLSATMGAEKSEQLSFGSELYRIRVKLGFSQSQVADEAGVRLLAELTHSS
jgi:hypothetical protein